MYQIQKIQRSIFTIAHDVFCKLRIQCVNVERGDQIQNHMHSSLVKHRELEFIRT
jgi:hypothetical protein